MREDWVECELGVLLDYEQPSKYIITKEEYNEKYPIPVLTAGKTFIKGYTNEQFNVFENLPTIIFDDFTTASQYVNFRFKVKSSAMKILIPSSKKVNLKYIFGVMQVYGVRAETHKRYWISEYSKIEIPLPPLVEQKAIVKKLEGLFSSLDAGIADLKKVLGQLEVYKQAVLKKAFENSSHQKKTIADICLPVSRVKKKQMNSNCYFIYIDISCIDNTSNKIVESKKLKWKDAPSRAQQIIKLNDVIFSTVRTYLKNIALVENESLDKQICSSGFTVLRADEKKIYFRYLFYYSLYDGFLNPLAELQTGSSYPAVRDKDVFSQRIYLPNSIEKQKQIVKDIDIQVSVCEDITKQVEESLAKAEALRHSILKKAFAGELLTAAELDACKADPNYESASLLLEKIEAEKKELKKKKK